MLGRWSPRSNKKSKACALLFVECLVFESAPGFHPVAAAAIDGAPEDSSPDLGFWPSSLSLLNGDASHISQSCHVKCDGTVAESFGCNYSLRWHFLRPGMGNCPGLLLDPRRN